MGWDGEDRNYTNKIELRREETRQRWLGDGMHVYGEHFVQQIRLGTKSSSHLISQQATGS